MIFQPKTTRRILIALALSFAIALALSFAFAIALPVLFRQINAGRTPNQSGLVSFSGWTISPHDTNICIAGTEFENGAILVSFAEDRTIKNKYTLSIQASNWYFSKEAIGQFVPAVIMVNDNPQRIETKAVIDNANRLSMQLDSRQMFLFNYQETTLKIQLNYSKTIWFELGPAGEAVDELDYCIDRLE